MMLFYLCNFVLFIRKRLIIVTKRLHSKHYEKFEKAEVFLELLFDSTRKIPLKWRTNFVYFAI